MEKTISNEVKINWTESDKLYGLDYSTKLGTYKDFKFDIRYDACGDLTEKPKCGCCLAIYFKSRRIVEEYGSMKYLIKYSKEWLTTVVLDYQLG